MKFLKIFFFLLLSITIFSQEKFYYTGKNYGSEALFNPVNVILNGSYDIIQLEGRQRDIFNYDYRKNSNCFFRNLGRPLYSISKYDRFSPGFWCVFHRKGNVILGLTTVYAPGLGLTFK